MDWTPLYLSLQLATLTTGLLLLIGLPLAGMLALTPLPGKPLWLALLNTPLVLPPSVLGFYLLVLLSPYSPLGAGLEALGIQLIFSFSGLVVGSVLFSLPFMVQPLYTALSQLPPSLREAAYTLGHSPINTFVRILIPNIRPAILTGSLLTFAHTLGEFGVVLMIGGSLPSTKVASVAIYEAVEALDYTTAHTYSLVMLGLALLLLVGLQLGQRSQRVS
jgi:molybdate transport system permease protein